MVEAGSALYHSAMQSRATTVEAYLDELPEDRRRAISAVRDTINTNLPKGYAEGMQYGMIGWAVPHELYPPGYHCDPAQPVPFASLASQKNHMALYLFCLYTDTEAMERFREAWIQTGARLDMGKSCVRFKRLEDVPLEVIGREIRRVTVTRFLASYEAARGAASAPRGARPSGSAKKKVLKKKVAPGKSATKSATPKKNAGRSAAVKKKSGPSGSGRVTTNKARRRAT